MAAEVSWTDEYGARVVVRGVCVDLSPGGVGLLCAMPVPKARRLEVKLQPDYTTKSARLRHCAQFGAAYLIGLQLS